MIKQALKERRIWPRAKRVLSIQFRLVKRQGRNFKKPWALSTTEDISLGGLAFYTDQEYRIRDILEISLTMSGIVDIFRGLAKVVRVEQKMTGAYFLVAVKLVDGKSRHIRTAGHQKRSKTTIVKRI